MRDNNRGKVYTMWVLNTYTTSQTNQAKEGIENENGKKHEINEENSAKFNTKEKYCRNIITMLNVK